MSFSFQELSEPVKRAVTELGYTVPTEIQAEAIPLLLSKDTDFVGQAQTGTGKTAAFCLPLIEKLDSSDRSLQALILSPTRELANQIFQELEKFTKYQSFNLATVYGGVAYKNQIAAVKKAQIVIATPGRAIDLLNKGSLNLSECKQFIIDEADEMLKMGFIEDVELLMDSIAKTAKTWMFSATMPSQIVRLMESKLDNPAMVRVKREGMSNGNITQSYFKLPKRDFAKALRTILMSEPDFFGIIFCETREETKNLGERLIKWGNRVAVIHGDLNQGQRDSAIEAFKSRSVELLVCTDVAARGIDITEVTHVINMGLPRKNESYIHRVGRTGRAGKSGKAISFVEPADGRKLQMIEKLTKQKLEPYVMPKALDMKNRLVAREVEKMETLKEAIGRKKDDFDVDNSFEGFEKFMADLSKEEIVKLMFSHHFNRDLKAIDESLANLKVSMEKAALSRGGSSRGRRDGGRSTGRRRDGRSRDRGERRADGRRGRSESRGVRVERGNSTDRPNRIEREDQGASRPERRSRRADNRSSDARGAKSRSEMAPREGTRRSRYNRQ